MFSCSLCNIYQKSLVSGLLEQEVSNPWCQYLPAGMLWGWSCSSGQCHFWGRPEQRKKRNIFLGKTPKVTHSAQASCWEWIWEYQSKNLSGPCSNFWHHSLTKNNPKALSGRATLAKFFLSPTETTEISRNSSLWPKWNKTSTYPTFSVLLRSFFLCHVVSLPGQVAVII